MMRFDFNAPLLRATVLVTFTLAAACGGSSATPEPGPSSTPVPVPTATPAPAPTEPGTQASNFEAHGSVGQVYVVGADPGQALELTSSAGETVQTGDADENGAFIFRKVASGSGYRVQSPSGATSPATGAIASVASDPVTVTGPDDHPEQSFYDGITITAGYQYVEMRDGTLLAINVLLPGSPEDGPYPTLVEYSGYSPADPSSPQPSTLIAQVLGYAAVGVNIRGTGCSGGAFEFFEDLQTTDGYDIIEAIAAQPWSANVGMVGISYPGISQLFVAQRQPPHLAAIAPLSVISDTGRGTLRPGGILNNGFAYEWAAGRDADSKPGGQGWSQRRMDDGDQTCIDNMQLRSQTPNIFKSIEDNEFYNPEVADPLAPATFVHRINVPVFLAGAWQDEQTGGYFANMIPDFIGTEDKRFHMQNGGHTDILSPEIFSRWLEFLDLFVAQKVPERTLTIPAILDFVATSIFGIDAADMALPPARFDGSETYAEALAFWRSEPQIRILMENGGLPDTAGSPIPTFEIEYAEWPPSAEARTEYFLPGGGLATEKPASASSESFVYDTSFAQVQTLDGVDQGGPWVANPGWNWRQRPVGTNLVYTTAALTADTLLVGTSAVNLLLRADAPDVDLQVTLSEVRADGYEVFVQNGWLRASRRMLDPELSTIFRPVATHLEEDAAALPAGEFVEVSIETFPFAHFFRAGSAIRVEIAAPGATRPRWRWETLEYEDETTIELSLGGMQASHIVLPWGAEPNTFTEPPLAYPTCPGLRAQPCRMAE
ncbi:MAG: CocE/NonD family hydrolase [Deltaproteobacteria bacterium]